MELWRSWGALNVCRHGCCAELWSRVAGPGTRRFGVRRVGALEARYRCSDVEAWRSGVLEARCRCSDVEALEV